MSPGNNVECILCQRFKENKITGPLSTKDDVTAHQNCLLYSSGLFCRESPQFDDLFGFSAKDVMKEVQRGRKLTCNKCKKKGATVGCEDRSCKKSYHYPCAIQAGARTFEDQDEGTFGLYCLYCQQTKPESSLNNSNGTTSSKGYCLACENAEGNIKKDSENVAMSYCKKHTPSTSWGNNDFGLSSDSDLSSTSKRSSKRRLDVSDQPEKKVAKRSKRIMSDDLTNSDVTEADEVSMFAPLESDPEENANSAPDEVIRKSPVAVAATASGSDNSQGDQNKAENEDSSIAQSEANSESLLLLLEATDISIDSSDFWKGCNSAGCTQAIFSHFIKDMTDIFTQITSDQASRQDCDVAFKVMMASGKLTELVAKQQKDLQKKLSGLQQAATALDKVARILTQ